MFTDFISKLDISDPFARTTLGDLWRGFIDQADGATARVALRRDFELALRAAGFPIGFVGQAKYVGGAQLPGKARKRWVVTDGKLKLALDPTPSN